MREVETQITVDVCRECNNPIDLDLCGYECPLDGERHPPESIRRCVYQLMKEENDGKQDS